MLLPPDLRDWLPEDHLVHFIVEAIELLGVESYHLNHRGSGSEQYPPAMMQALLVYCYATGRCGSRTIEDATHIDVAVRYICANTHPDHDTICAFRRNNGKAFRETFVKVLELACEQKCMSRVGIISIDGTKIQANASKHSAVSYGRAGELIEQLRLEVDALMKEAEKADAEEESTVKLPDEIRRREDRIARLKEAREVIRERHEEERKEKQAEYEAKVAKREAQRDAGKKPRGREPVPPSEEPDRKKQYNFTDPESRIMKAGNKGHFEQSWNAQAAVDADGSQLILGNRLTNAPNDKNELVPTVNEVENSPREVGDVLADNGYYNGPEIEKLERTDGVQTYVAVEKTLHGVKLDELLGKLPSEAEPPAEADTAVKMRHRMRSAEGRQKYRLRKHTVEPVFGIIKSVMGFRQFLLRGHPKVSLEWDLVCLAYNMKRLFKLNDSRALPEIGWQVACGG